MITKSLFLLCLGLAYPAHAANDCLTGLAHPISLDVRLTVAACSQGSVEDQTICVRRESDALLARIKARLSEEATERCETGTRPSQ
jgi:hypothetical protein